MSFDVNNGTLKYSYFPNITNFCLINNSCLQRLLFSIFSLSGCKRRFPGRGMHGKLGQRVQEKVPRSWHAWQAMPAEHLPSAVDMVDYPNWKELHQSTYSLHNKPRRSVLRWFKVCKDQENNLLYIFSYLHVFQAIFLLWISQRFYQQQYMFSI